MAKLEDAFLKGKNIISNKQTRSVILILITIFVVFALNSLLPIIEGSTHYTADAVTMTYREYKDKSEADPNYRMTWVSSQNVELYITNYIKAHPDLPLEEQLLIEPPDGFKVDVYTKFFFQHPFWYMTTVVNLVSALLIFYAIFNYLITKRKTTYKRYIDLDNEVVALTQESLDPVTFEPWMVDSFNKPRKIKQHISNIKYKLDLLERRTKYKYKHPVENSPYMDKHRIYMEKKQELQSYLDPAYIEEYVMDRDVKGFLYIYPTFVTSGYNMTGRTTDSFSRIRSNAQRLGRDSIKKVAISTMLTVMFATLLTVTIINSTDKPWYWIVLNVITSITPLIIQIPMAFDYCDSYMDEQLVTNLIARRTIAYLYLADMKEQEQQAELEKTRMLAEQQYENAQARAQEEYFQTFNTKEEESYEDITTEGHGDTSISSNGGDSEGHSETS